MEIKYEDLERAELIVDCTYKGGLQKNIGASVLPKLLPKCGNSGGFRKVARKDDPSKMAYVVLYTSMEELEWPDFLDEETGLFRYYGDNRKPGRAITDTKQGGNRLLERVFNLIHSHDDISDIPPFLVFKKTGTGHDVKFLGLAAPGNPRLSSDKDLVAFWRTIDENRFQNYESYFTILDTGKEPISKYWLRMLIEDHDHSLEYAPSVWRKFIKNGINGIEALKAPKILTIPNKYAQLQSDVEGSKCVEIIRQHFKDDPYGFEACASDIVSKLDPNFSNFVLTRPWRDGGRDALGYYVIKSGRTVNAPLKIDCALEAKCYSQNNAVGVKQMSRLISRIRYRQFGIMITTSYVDAQAYREVVEDGHPILILTATDIAAVLRNKSIKSSDMDGWFRQVERNAIRQS